MSRREQYKGVPPEGSHANRSIIYPPEATPYETPTPVEVKSYTLNALNTTDERFNNAQRAIRLGSKTDCATGSHGNPRGGPPYIENRGGSV